MPNITYFGDNGRVSSYMYKPNTIITRNTYFCYSKVVVRNNVLVSKITVYLPGIKLEKTWFYI